MFPYAGDWDIYLVGKGDDNVPLGPSRWGRPVHVPVAMGKTC